MAAQLKSSVTTSKVCCREGPLRKRRLPAAISNSPNNNHSEFILLHTDEPRTSQPRLHRNTIQAGKSLMLCVESYEMAGT
jgi:hypothetical protein